MAIQKPAAPKKTAPPKKAAAPKAAKKAAPKAKVAVKRAAAKPPVDDTLDRFEGSVAVWRRIVSMAWEDAGFLDQLVKNPKKILAANGLKVGPDVTYVVHTDTPTTKHFVVPHRHQHHDGGSGGGHDHDQDDDSDGDPCF